MRHRPATELRRTPAAEPIRLRCARRQVCVGGSGKRGLRKRLNEFRKYGAGVPIDHTGGRRIWQLVDHAELLVGWRVTDDAQARPTERALIAAFRAYYDARPFANTND